MAEYGDLKTVSSATSMYSNLSSDLSSDVDDYEEESSTAESPTWRNVVFPLLGNSAPKHKESLKYVAPTKYLSLKMSQVLRKVDDSPVGPAFVLFRNWMTKVFLPMAFCISFYTCVNQVTLRAYGSSHRAIALGNAHVLIWFEQATGLLQSELFLVDLFVRQIDNDALMIFISYFYLYAHIPLTVLFCVLAYGAVLRPDHPNNFFELTLKDWLTWRNAIIYATTTYCIMSLLFPCAPPRMLPEFGFVDTTEIYTSLDQTKEGNKIGVNHFAAVPSMHFGYAAFVGYGMFRYAKRGYMQVLGVLYASWVLFSIVVTGNHFVMDAVFSAIVNYLSWIPVEKKQRTGRVFGDGPVTRLGAWLVSKVGRR